MLEQRGNAMRNLLGFVALVIAVGPVTMSMAKPAVPEANSVSKELLRTDKTLSGQPLRLGHPRAQVVASATDFPANAHTTIHKHPWSRFVYVERGPLWVTNFDRHRTDEFQTGQVFAEAVGQWHQGHAGPKGARLVVFDLVPPGTINVVSR
jgi:quercetin dioxygenase-like cupin family protein